MFEVDWADPDCERVGERRARKEVERELKKKDDARSSHGSISSRASTRRSARASTSSDQHHLSLFGSIGRKKNTASSSKSKGQEPATPSSDSAEPNAKSKRSSLRLPFAISSVAKVPDDVVAVPENEPLDILSMVARKALVDGMDLSCPETPDRSSKESMMSKMTDLTVPTLESPRVHGSTGETTPSKAGFLQAQGGRDVSGAGTVKAFPHQGGNNFTSVQTSVEIEATVSPKTPRIPIPAPILVSPSTGGDGKSTSEVIDDWFTALHGPTRRLPRRGPNGTIRQGNVLLPPNLHQPLPTTPTRHSARRHAVMSPNSSRVRFIVDDPDHWKSPDEWDHQSSPTTEIPAGDNNGVSAQEEKVLSLMAADLKDIHSQEEDILSLMAADLKAIHFQEEETVQLAGRTDQAEQLDHYSADF